jgi:hypothetical protein
MHRFAVVTCRSRDIATKIISFFRRGISQLRRTLRTSSHVRRAAVWEWPCVVMKFGGAGKDIRR